MVLYIIRFSFFSHAVFDVVVDDEVEFICGETVVLVNLINNRFLGI